MPNDGLSHLPYLQRRTFGGNARKRCGQPALKGAVPLRGPGQLTCICGILGLDPAHPLQFQGGLVGPAAFHQ